MIDASGKVVMPGFVDPHTHVVFMHTREKEFEMRIQGKTYVEISLAGGGIRSSIQSVRDASEDDLYLRAKKHVQRMMACGTTTMESKSGYGLYPERTENAAGEQAIAGRFACGHRFHLPRCPRISH